MELGDGGDSRVDHRDLRDQLFCFGGCGAGAAGDGRDADSYPGAYCGLLLVALAMQFFVNGLTELGVIQHQ